MTERSHGICARTLGTELTWSSATLRAFGHFTQPFRHVKQNLCRIFLTLVPGASTSDHSVNGSRCITQGSCFDFSFSGLQHIDAFLVFLWMV